MHAQQLVHPTMIQEQLAHVRYDTCYFMLFINFQVVLDNPCTFENPFQFEITFECRQELEDGT